MKTIEIESLILEVDDWCHHSDGYYGYGDFWEDQSWHGYTWRLLYGTFKVKNGNLKTKNVLTDEEIVGKILQQILK